MKLNLKFDPEHPFNNAGFWIILILMLICSGLIFIKAEKAGYEKTSLVKTLGQAQINKETATPPPPALDKEAYDQKLMEIANLPAVSSTTPSSTTSSLWPVKAAYPEYGALLPFNRIVAYYGNLYSKNMGVLGEYPEDEMLARLETEVKKWEEADPNTPVVPALHYIAVVAQAGPGRDGKYRARMPDEEIDKVLAMAKKVDALVFLDIQVGLSDVRFEIPILEKYLRLPNVHLGIDPEFSMKSGDRPGTVIGTLDADDINFAAEYLAKIVNDNRLTPKILVIHRFTQAMVTNYKDIKPLPEVQVVMDMDGFGGQASKLNTYEQYIRKQPVQFTGFKLFYKNDNANGHTMFAPAALLKLSPIPVYIQYQ